MSAQPYAGLLERLRDADRNSVQRTLGSGIFGEAAEAISSLLKALKVAAAIIGGPSNFDGLEDDDVAILLMRVRVGDVKMVRAALNSDASTQTVGGGQ